MAGKKSSNWKIIIKKPDNGYIVATLSKLKIFYLSGTFSPHKGVRLGNTQQTNNF